MNKEQIGMLLFSSKGKVSKKIFIITMIIWITLNTLLCTIDGTLEAIVRVLILLAIFPTVNIICKRLNAINRSQWFGLIWFIPIVGDFIILIWLSLAKSVDTDY